MSKRADAFVIRIAQPDEREELEELQRRASLANENDRPHLEAHPDAIHLPPAQIANGQVMVAELGGRVVGFAAVVGGELDGLFVEPELWRRGGGPALVEGGTHLARVPRPTPTRIAKPASRGFYLQCGGSL